MIVHFKYCKGWSTFPLTILQFDPTKNGVHFRNNAGGIKQMNGEASFVSGTLFGLSVNTNYMKQTAL